MHSVVQPNEWVTIKLPSEAVRLLQVVPNSTISLGKYGSFPSNLIIHRPFHLTYEVLDKQPGESFSRLRVVPTSEIYEDILRDEEASAADDSDNIISATDGVEYSLVDEESGEILARSDHATVDESARQLLTWEEIEELKRDGSAAGKDLIAKLLLSHTAIDKKTAFSLAKYKILKTKKFIRRFSVQPLDSLQMANLLFEKDAPKILELRSEMLALVGCWANAHFSGCPSEANDAPVILDPKREFTEFKSLSGRWLVVDDTSGLLVAAIAERMGILYPPDAVQDPQQGNDEEIQEQLAAGQGDASHQKRWRPKEQHRPDFEIPYASRNTITLIHTNSQPNLSLLRYWGFDPAAPNLDSAVVAATVQPAFRAPPSSLFVPGSFSRHGIPSQAPHPLGTHLLSLSWLQLVRPEVDTLLSTVPADLPEEVTASWKPGRRGQYHRKRRRWARTRYMVDSTRAGASDSMGTDGFDGLVVASMLDPVSVLRHTVPLLRGGAAVAVYSPNIEPLVELADCFATAKRSDWMRRENARKIRQEEAGNCVEDEEDGGDGAGGEENATEAFEINPMLLVGVQIQTCRARKWQVLPGRTHPVMSSKGGAEGYIFTGWRAIAAEGRVEARGKRKRR